METQTAGAACDKGRKYELSVAALLAFHLSDNENVKHYCISSEIKQYYPFDDIVAEVRFKESAERQIYAIQTKCGKDKFKIQKYIEGYKIIGKSSPQFKQNIREDSKQNIREDRIQFWYFNPTDINNFKNKSDIKTVPHKKYEGMGSRDILDTTNCYKLDCDEYKDFFESFYLFLKQPNTRQIIRKIKDKWKIEDPWQIIFYFDKQFAKRSNGVDKASFEHELLKIRLSNYIVTPMEATLFRHQAVNDWNRLTLEHNVTIVGKELNIEQHLHGCIVQSISDIININKWNDAIRNGGKLDEDVITQLNKRSIEAETLKDFMVEMWVKNEVPLLLQTDAPLPILEEFRNLNKSYIIIDSNPKERSTEIQGYNLSVFRRLYDVKDDNIIRNIVVSLQGRQKASLDEIIHEDKKLMKAITCLDIINLIKPREVFLKEECLNGNNYMLFLIETVDPLENNYNSLRPTGDNITIYCTPHESLHYYEQITGDSRFKSYKIFRVRPKKDNKLILLSEIQEARTVGVDDGKCGLECFFVDQNGESVYNRKNSDPIPVIGEIPIHVRWRYVPRYLCKCIMEKERQPTDEDISVECSIGGDIKKKRRQLSGKGSYIEYTRERFAEQEFFKKSNSPITIITGEPGIGKTTLLHSLFRFCETKYYVLFVNLASCQSDLYKRNQRLLQNPLQFLYDKQEATLYRRFLTSLRKPNRLILILDSFDEVIATCEEQVLELVENLQKAGLQKILIASRLTAVSLLRDKFEEADTFKLEEFGEELEEHIANWNLNISDLDNVPSKFLRNPLYLGMLRTLSDYGKNLAVTNTWDLFEGIVNLKIENYCRRIEPYCLDENDKQDILSWHWELALQAVAGINTQKLIRSPRRNFARVGFITYYDNENPIFVHRTLAEFFVGQWLIENIDQHEAKCIYLLLLAKGDMRILDIISERLPLHKFMLGNAIEINDLSRKVNERNILETDALGRNILYLALFYVNGVVSEKNGWQFLDFLIYYMRKKKYDIYMRDRILNWTWVEYVEYCGLEKYFLKRSHMWDGEFVAVREAYVNYYATRIEKLEQFPLSRNFSELFNNALYYSSINMIQDLLLLKYHHDEAFSKFRRMCLHSSARIDERLLKFHLPEEKLTGAHLACIYSNTEALKIYIENQTNLNQTDIFNCTPLHYGAIAEQGNEIVKLLLEHCEMSNSKVAQYGWSTTILHMSVRTGNVNVTKMILEHCGNLQDSWDSDNCTPLEIALILNLTNNYGGHDCTHLDVLKALLEKGTVEQHYYRFLQTAVVNKNKNVAGILLSHGVDATRGLFYAVDENDEDFTEFLLKNGADPNYFFRTDTALMSAIRINKGMHYNSSERESNLKIIDLLLHYDADVDKTNELLYTPLDYTTYFDIAEDVVQKLLDHETCNVNLISKKYLHQAIKHRRLEIVQLFLKNGARVDCVNAYGWVPLNYATKKAEKDIVQMLLEYKADINGVDRFGFTPLITAVEKGNIEFVELLLRKGAEIDFRNEFGVTALYVAAFKGNVAMTKLLLEKGADLNTVTFGDQILYNAKQAKKIEAIVLLLKNRTVSQPPGNSSETDLAVNNIIEKVRQNWAGVNLELELHSAVQEGLVNVHTVKLLSEWGNRKSLGEYWSTAFRNCEEMNDKGVENAFLQRLKDYQFNNLIAYICNAPSVNKNLSIITILSRYHKTSFKVFEKAIASNNWEVLQIVLQNYNDFDINFLFNPLCYAVCIQSEEMIKILLTRNSKVNRIGQCFITPLVLASSLENVTIAEILLKNGADANWEGIYEVSPFHIAALLENLDMAYLLLRYGAKPSVPRIEYSLLLSRVQNILTKTKSSLVVGETMNSDRFKQIVEEASRNIPWTSKERTHNYRNRIFKRVCCLYYGALRYPFVFVLISLFTIVYTVITKKK